MFYFFLKKDFELEEIIKMKNQTNFPWIMSNVFYKPSGKPLGDGIEYLIIESNGLKVFNIILKILLFKKKKR